jgi:hypothetical protein
MLAIEGLERLLNIMKRAERIISDPSTPPELKKRARATFDKANSAFEKIDQQLSGENYDRKK